MRQSRNGEEKRQLGPVRDVLPKIREILRRMRWKGSTSDGVGTDVPTPTPMNFSHLLHFYFASRNIAEFCFVQVGAHDGKVNDFLYEYAIKLNLRGVLIEPQADAFAELKKNYKGNKNVLFENVAVSGENGQRQLYTIKRELDFLKYANQAASFDYCHIRRLLEEHLRTSASRTVRQRCHDLGLSVAECIEAEIVETRTLQAILDGHGIVDFDLLQIDAESFDYEILKTIDFGRYRPSLITYEHEHLAGSHRQDAWAYLRALGYEVFTHQGNTTGYLVEPSFAPRSCQ